MSKQGKHHFVPVFYLKQWAGADKRICEYKQRYHGVIALPISPRTFFLAYRSDDLFRQIAALSQDELVETINNAMAGQAVEFVYAFDDSQTAFIRNRFGSRLRSTPLDPVP